MATFTRRTHVPASAEEVFRWHARPGALERLTPPWTRLEVIERTGGIESGARAMLRIPLGPTQVRWVAEHRDYIEGRQFRDVQVEGPFARWEHTHRFDPDGPDSSFLEDHINYEMPLGLPGALIGGPFVHAMLERTFTYRHRITADDLATHARYDGATLQVLLSGASGLVGSALVPFLTTGGHRVTRLVRHQPPSGSNAIRWHPESGALDAPDLPAVDTVIHLAGENIAGSRWTAAVKERIKHSRVTPTRLLCETLARWHRPPAALICASGVGFYGDTGAQTCDEDSASGTGFLAEVSREWETATAPAADAGIRVVNLRLGVVLSPAGGALAKLLVPFQLGVGGRVGSGQQYMSWIALDDVLAIILHAIRMPQLRGPVNAVVPQAVTNLEFTRTLGHVLSRPTLFPVPAAAARFAFGEMADEMLLASSRVQPARLVTSAYTFRHPDLEGALRHMLGK